MTKAIAVLSMAALASVAQAAESYDQTITAIFGSGNPDGGWTVSESSGGEVVLGLRGKERIGGAFNNANDVYTFDAGLVGTPTPNRATWNWEFSVATPGGDLDNYTYSLAVDMDGSQGTSFLMLDPMTAWTDSSFGETGLMNGAVSSLANGGGIEYANAAAYLVGGGYGGFEVMQNSQNIVFYGLDAFANSTFDYVLSAFDGNELIAQASIQVIVGQGGEPVANPVPEPSTVIGGTLLGALALGRLAKRRRK
jgi:hypothetical protein